MPNILEFGKEILEDRYEGALAASKDKWYQMKVDEATRLLVANVSRLKERVDSGDLDKEFVADKVATAVLRVIRNPEGLSNESEGNYSYGLANRVASGDLWYQEKDLNDLREAGDHGVGQFRLRPTPGWGP